MILTTVRIERPEGTAVATGLAAQIELVAPRLILDNGGDRPYMEYDILLDGITSAGVQRRDLLIDEQNIDPLTGNNTHYRVAAVEIFDREHIECRAQLVIGT